VRITCVLLFELHVVLRRHLPFGWRRLHADDNSTEQCSEARTPRLPSGMTCGKILSHRPRTPGWVSNIICGNQKRMSTLVVSVYHMPFLVISFKGFNTDGCLRGRAGPLQRPAAACFAGQSISRSCGCFSCSKCTTSYPSRVASGSRTLTYPPATFACTFPRSSGQQIKARHGVFWIRFPLSYGRGTCPRPKTGQGHSR
jgi:hypothetical protein